MAGFLASPAEGVQERKEEIGKWTEMDRAGPTLESAQKERPTQQT
jgi:hypothetical protein